MIWIGRDRFWHSVLTHFDQIKFIEFNRENICDARDLKTIIIKSFMKAVNPYNAWYQHIFTKFRSTSQEQDK